MKDMLFSVNSWIYGKAPIETIAKSAKAIGVDGIDVSGEPDELDAVRVKKALDEYGLRAFCINGHYLRDDRAFNHSDASMRQKAVEYGKKCVDLAVAVGAPKVLIVPSQVNRGSFYASKETDWQNSVSAVREVAEYANQFNITIVLECVNKYEIAMVRTLQDGIQMARDTGCDNVKIIADTFHMQLEEQNGIQGALRQAGGEWIGHLHIADNTRDVPGKGCFDWREILMALSDIGYTEAISFEELPRGLSLDDIFAGVLTVEELTNELGFSLRYLKMIMKTIA